MEYIDLTPSSATMMESLRNIGYSVETAVADIIDNSITANAKRIEVRFSWNNESPWLAVIDDGHGMKYDEFCFGYAIRLKEPARNKSFMRFR